MPGQAFETYSFLDVQASLVAPGFTFDLASAGIAAEGIRISMLGEKIATTIGADGNGMHSLIASMASNCEITILKSAPANAMLNALYNFQTATSANTGNIQITINNPAIGDTILLVGGAIVKQADIAYAEQATLNVWPFRFIARHDILGNGLNARAVFVPA